MGKHIYCVSYSWAGTRANGFGNIEITSTTAITTIEAVRNIEKVINEKLSEPGATAVVINLILLRTEE